MQRNQPDGVPPLSSRASARSPTCRRRTTGTAATWPSTSGSPRASAASASSTWPAARATAASVLARTRAQRRRRRRQPRGARARAAALRAPAPALRARPRRDASPSTSDAVVFLQTIEHVAGPGRDPRALQARCCAPGGVAFVSTPNVLTLAPEGAEKSEQPVARQGVPRRGVPRAVRGALRARRAVRPVPRAQAARARAGDQKRGWDAIHRRLGITKPFYDWFTPAISASDFALRGHDAQLDRRSTSSPSAARERRRGRSRRAGARPAHPHAVRRGLRHVAVRRGVAVGGDRDVLPAAARACSTRAAAPVTLSLTPVLVRPARGAGRRASASARSCATCGRETHRARRRRLPRERPRRWRAELRRAAARLRARR